MEYLVLDLTPHHSSYTPRGLQEKLNELGKDRWEVACYCPQGLILMRVKYVVDTESIAWIAEKLSV
jgi:hypothetical protein